MGTPSYPTPRHPRPGDETLPSLSRAPLLHLALGGGALCHPAPLGCVLCLFFVHQSPSFYFTPTLRLGSSRAPLSSYAPICGPEGHFSFQTTGGPTSFASSRRASLFLDSLSLKTSGEPHSSSRSWGISPAPSPSGFCACVLQGGWGARSPRVGLCDLLESWVQGVG